MSDWHRYVVLEDDSSLEICYGALYDTYEEAKEYIRAQETYGTDLNQGFPDFKIVRWPRIEKITPEIFEAEMKKIREESDTEGGYLKADWLMMETLIQLGYKDGVMIFNDFDKWYS